MDTAVFGYLGMRVNPGRDQAVQNQPSQLVLQCRHAGVEGRGHAMQVHTEIWAEVLGPTQSSLNLVLLYRAKKTASGVGLTCVRALFLIMLYSELR